MADQEKVEGTEEETPEGGGTAELEGGSYEVIRTRLLEQSKELASRTDALNDARQEAFGGTELTVIANERVRTENNCTPMDIVQVGGKLLFGFNVFIGLKQETAMSDVFSLHRFEPGEDGAIDLSVLPVEEGGPGLLVDSTFDDHFKELYRFYKGARLVQLTRTETQMLAVWQIGGEISDVRVSRWRIDPSGAATYVDNRGERDYEFPPQHDFEWTVLGREAQVSGDYPHVSILDKVFVETTGGDLTVKVENNTASGEGIYAEPVSDAYQTLDDAEFHYVEIGPLILIKIKPYREEVYRYLVFSTRSHHTVRIDPLGDACISLPEDHGIIFPGGYYLQDGQYKVFDGDYDGFEFQRRIRSPNGEDVLYVFHRRGAGQYALFNYNLIRREVGTPIHCNGYSLFDDGKMVVFKFDSNEPTRVHPMQVWQTPFVSDEHHAETPNESGFLGKLGNADLVRGISDCYSIRRFIVDQEPSRQVFEDLIRNVTRTIDAYHWLGDTEHVGDLASVLHEIRSTSELIVDEFEKVVQIKRRAAEALAEAETEQEQLLRGLRPDSWERVDDFMEALTSLRTQRGHLITLKEMRYADVDKLDALEEAVVEAFDTVSKSTVDFLLRDEALQPLTTQLDELLEKSGTVAKTNEMQPIVEDIERVSEGLTVLSEVAANLEVDDPTARTTILEGISEVFSHLNRVRATVDNRRKELLGSEGRAEFSAQFKLFAQSVNSSIGMADTPERCDELLSRLMVQLEELEAKFSEFDEFIGDLAAKREEVYDAFGQKKQQLLDERQRRVQNLWGAAERIIGGLQRRAGTFEEPDQLNSFFASDPMVLKLRDLGERIAALGDSVKADEVQSKLKSARQDALRGLRDRQDLFEGSAEGKLIKLGRHRFTVNEQPLELGVLPHSDGMALTLSGTDFLETIDDEEFETTRDFWSQQLPSETGEVYRGEYLAASILFAAEAGDSELSMEGLVAAEREEGGLAALVRKVAADRYQEGYDRGVHDADATAILEKLLTLYGSAGLLRYAPTARALASLFWSEQEEGEGREGWHRRAQSLGRLRASLGRSPALERLVGELHEAIAAFVTEARVPIAAAHAPTAARYLAEELGAVSPLFVTSADAQRLHDGFVTWLDEQGSRHDFEEDMTSLEGAVGDRFSLARAWLEAWVARSEDEDVRSLEHAVAEAAAVFASPRGVDREANASLTVVDVTDLLGQHSRIQSGKLRLRIDEFIERLTRFIGERLPAYRQYRELRQSLIERERRRLRVEEYKPRVLSSFVRNKLISEVYLPLVGDNLAKQLGAAGEGKRTDLMGLLLLVSPPGYGKTTLMEYIANRLGLVFMKVNGPSLGHGVHSLDPAEAPNATARQEVEKINLAFEMGNNVMLYLDDIQHTHPELLQKFISLCDAQRRIEGVWKGVTRTYDLRGKKFCVVMAGNPYTESGDKFQIPDMLANRADTYNLGDILSGKDDAFALSYIENAITSNRVLAPLATREQKDIYLLIRMAQGEEIPTTDLEHGYSAAEIDEITGVLRHMLACQEVLLQVNGQYITSAATDEKFRTEPRFQLQGSYRNMNKLAEKIVPAMNAEEIERLVDDHYQSEAQTLTSGAEHNLLKLAQMRETMTEEQTARWEHVKKEFNRHKLMGGGDNDPVSRVTGQISLIGDQLEGIKGALGQTDHLGGLVTQLEQIREALGQSDHLEGLGARLDAIGTAVSQAASAVGQAQAQAQAQTRAPAEGGSAAERQIQTLSAYLQRLESAIQGMQRPRIELTVDNKAPAGVEELLAQQIAIIERTLVPLVRTTNQQIANPGILEQHIAELVGLLRGVDQRMRAGQPAVAPIGAAPPSPGPVHPRSLAAGLGIPTGSVSGPAPGRTPVAPAPPRMPSAPRMPATHAPATHAPGTPAPTGHPAAAPAVPRAPATPVPRTAAPGPAPAPVAPRVASPPSTAAPVPAAPTPGTAGTPTTPSSSPAFPLPRRDDPKAAAGTAAPAGGTNYHYAKGQGGAVTADDFSSEETGTFTGTGTQSFVKPQGGPDDDDGDDGPPNPPVFGR